LDSIVSVRGGEFGDNWETPGIWDKIASAQNSKDFGMEPVPEDPSINDSMSSMINFGIIMILTMNRTIKQLKTAVVKTASTLQTQVQDWVQHPNQPMR